LMVPVLPFSALFAAIVQAQAPECYTRSGHFLGLAECLRPKPPELTMVVVPTPTEEEFINHDVLYWRPKCHLPPRIPPYTTTRRSPEPETDCTKPTLSHWVEGDLLRVQRCLPNRWDICPIDEAHRVLYGPDPSARAWRSILL
jgi:hypothetical protein